MYLRFLKLDTKGADLRAIQEFYQQKVLPLLQQHSACRFASLLQATSKAEECISMTFWDSPEAADRYEHSVDYLNLLEEGTKLVSGTAEWNVRLSEGPALEPHGSPEPTIGDAFTVEAGDEELPNSNLPARLYLKIVSVRVKPGKWDDLIDIYDTAVLPTLHSTPGCRAAFLVEALHDPDQALSVSIWNREEDAIRYEMSGAFDEFTAKVSEFFSGLYQWKLSLASEGEDDSVSGKNLDVRGYQLVTGRRLGS